MLHTQIIRASDLNDYANTHASQSTIPQLVSYLVRQANPVVCRIPYDAEVNQRGWDGKVELPRRFRQYIPAGSSYWEITTSSSPKDAAQTNIEKRREALPDSERANATFVFVTPRTGRTGGWPEPDQDEWQRQAREEYGWKNVRVLDGTQLADWLQEFPALARWLACRMGRLTSQGSLETPLEYWENAVPRVDPGDRRLPPSLFLDGRDAARSALHEILLGQRSTLHLLCESEDDVADFVAASLQGLPKQEMAQFPHRCLFVSDLDAWHAVCELTTPHVLVASPRLGLDSVNEKLQTIATTKNHAIVVPLCGRWLPGDASTIRLRSPTRHAIEEVLRKEGFPAAQCRKLAQIGGGQLAALKRHLRGLGKHPPYATWENAASTAQAGLAGRWNGENFRDRSAVEQITGRKYSEWIPPLRQDSLKPDAPMVQQDELWRFVVRSEAWNALGPALSNDDLDRFRPVAVSVLTEDDPRFDLPANQRLAASLFEKTPKYSEQLRAGIAETVALLGSRPKFLSSCTQHKAGYEAHVIVRSALSGASWKRWASLGSDLALLAEGSPEQFLEAVELALDDPESSPFGTLLREDSDDSTLLGTSEMAGTLWALETLAWSGTYLPRAAVALAGMASIDPGGRWANRPQNSLRTIFLPWFPQTTANDDTRIGALKAVLREHPDVGWNLLVSLLPQGSGTSMGSRQPTWRDWIPANWAGGVQQSEYWESVNAYFGLAMVVAGNRAHYLRALVDRLPDLPPALHHELLARLESPEVRNLDEAERFIISEGLEDVVRLHKRFSDAKWALPDDALSRIEQSATRLGVSSPVLTAKWLFRQSVTGALDGDGSFEEQHRRLQVQRQQAIRQILDDRNISSVCELACSVSNPIEVGDALAHVAAQEEQAELVVRFLSGMQTEEQAMFSAFVWRRFVLSGWSWVSSVGLDDMSTEDRAGFLSFLPFRSDVWEKVPSLLGGEDQRLYWARLQINPYPVAEDLSTPVHKFLEYDRIDAAILCISSTIRDDRFNADLAADVLITLLERGQGGTSVNWGAVVETIVRLQQSSSVSRKRLFQIEWGYLPLLGIGSEGSPVTLAKHLATDPEFFLTVVDLVYRPDSDLVEGASDEDREHVQSRWRNAYQLLDRWSVCPGVTPNGGIDEPVLRGWIEKARGIAKARGQLDMAEHHIGKVFVQTLRETDDPWIPDVIAEILDERALRGCRKGFMSGLLAARGVFVMSGGRQERDLERRFRERAQRLDSQGYARLAGTIREVADYYRVEGERFAAEEANRE